jgi:hypothetical protein
MSSIFALISDLHCGSKLALCPPAITLDEGGTYRANKGQLWLWPHYLKFWEVVKEKTTKKFMQSRPDLYLGFVGEFRDGVHFTSQSITTNEADIAKMVRQALQPAIELEPDYSFVWRGSRAHSGNASWFDEFIADGLKDELNVQPDIDGRYAAWERNLWIEDVLFDITHHVSMGRLPHTEGPSVARAANLLAQYYERDERLPDVAIRGHQHRMYDTGDIAPIRMITLPSWKFNDAYIMKLTQSRIPHFGGVVFEIDGGIKDVVKYRVSPRRQAAWKKSQL